MYGLVLQEFKKMIMDGLVLQEFEKMIMDGLVLQKLKNDHAANLATVALALAWSSIDG